MITLTVILRPWFYKLLTLSVSFADPLRFIFNCTISDMTMPLYSFYSIFSQDSVKCWNPEGGCQDVPIESMQRNRHMGYIDIDINVDLDPVVQTIVSLTKSLVNDLLSLLVRLKSSVIIFFAEKMWGAFAFFRHKNGSVFMYNMFEILTLR